MSHSKRIVLTAVFSLFFFTTGLYAVGPADASKANQKNPSFLDGIAKSLGSVVDDVGKSLGGTADGIGKALGGTVDGIGKALGGTVDGVGKSLGGTVNGLGKFLGDTGEVAGDVAMGVASVAVVAGVVYLYFLAGGGDYHFPHGHYNRSNRSYHRGYRHR